MKPTKNKTEFSLYDLRFHEVGRRDPAEDRFLPARKPVAKYSHATHPTTGAQIQLKMMPTQEELLAYHLHELQRISGKTYAESGYLHEGVPA